MYPAVWAWSLFYFISIIIISIIPELQEPMGGSTVDTSLLLAATALGIGIGCGTAGLCSGKSIRVGMVPWGAVGLAGAWFLLGLLPLDFATVFGLLLLGGLAAGFFIVPLQAMQQRLAPPEQRGRYLATANALCYVMMTVAALVYIALIYFGLGPQQIFFVCSGCQALILAWLLLKRGQLAFNDADYR